MIWILRVLMTLPIFAPSAAGVDEPADFSERANEIARTSGDKLNEVTGNEGTGNQVTAAELISQARQAYLNREDPKQWQGLYSRVGVKELEFPQRVHDAFFIHLDQGNFSQAFKLLVLSERLDLELEHRDYLRRLAMTLSGVCTLGSASGPWQDLVEAHIYRFGDRFLNRNYSATPLAGASRVYQFHFTERPLAWLRQIPSIRLIAGQGCSKYQSRLEKRELRQQWEYQKLYDWYRYHKELIKDPHQIPKGFHPALMRLLELAVELKDHSSLIDLLHIYAEMPQQQWREIDSQDGQLLWLSLVQAEVFEPPPYGQEQQVYLDRIEALIEGCGDDQCQKWLGLLDWKQLDAATQKRLLDLLDGKGSIKHRDALHLLAAKYHYQRSLVHEALARLSVILKATDLDPAEQAIQQALSLSLSIFSEYRFDKGLWGAMTSSLAVDKRVAILEAIWIDAALSGHKTSIERLETLMEELGRARSLYRHQDSRSLVKAVGQRQTRTFQALIRKKFSQRPRLNGDELKFYQLMAARMMLLEPRQRRALAPFWIAMAEPLEAMNHKNTFSESLEALRKTFSSFVEDRHAQGPKSVEKQVVVAGSITIERHLQHYYPFDLGPLPSLPRRDLLMQPTGFDLNHFALR